jgi:AcrR family transcriptional regulator
VLDAAERLIHEDAFHLATMDELAAAAVVSRATVFNRFGSKLGVLQALFVQGMEGPEMEAIRDALELEDPLAALEAVIDASCAIWDAHAFVHEQLQAIVVLEPGASALVDRQREEQRADVEALAALSQVGYLRTGLRCLMQPPPHAPSLRPFLWLWRDGLSLQTRDTIVELARGCASRACTACPSVRFRRRADRKGDATHDARRRIRPHHGHR